MRVRYIDRKCKPSPNAQFDAFNAQTDRGSPQMDKIRRSGFGRVDDRTRGFTRIRAGACAYVS